MNIGSIATEGLRFEKTKIVDFNGRHFAPVMLPLPELHQKATTISPKSCIFQSKNAVFFLCRQRTLDRIRCDQYRL